MSTAEWNNLSSGLIGAVIGSFLGFLGSVAMSWLAERAKRKGAGRAVLAEMFTNADRALGAESTLVLHEFLDSAWRQQLPLLAQLLTWNELKTLVNAYDSAARGFENAKDSLRQSLERPTRMGEEPQRNRELSRITGWFLTVSREWLAAMHVLIPLVLNGNNRRAFNDDLEKIEKRVKSSPNETR